MEGRATGALNDKINFYGAKIDTLTSQNVFHEIIKEQTHILDTSSYYFLCSNLSYGFWCACLFRYELSS